MDAIKGEVLVPQSRFLPKCECVPPIPIVSIEKTDKYGDSYIPKLYAICALCYTMYERETSYGVSGIAHGKII